MLPYLFAQVIVLSSRSHLYCPESYRKVKTIYDKIRLSGWFDGFHCQNQIRSHILTRRLPENHELT